MTKKISTQSLPDTQALLTSRLATKVVHIPKFQSIFRQGDVSDGVMFIQSGTVKVTVVNAQGTTTAIAPTILIFIQKPEMQRALREDSEIPHQFSPTS